MWEQWKHAREESTPNSWRADLPHDLFGNIASAGGTVFAESRWYKPAHAQAAHDFEMKYFATFFISGLHEIPGERKAITKTSELSHCGSPWCPLDETLYENAFVKPFLEGTKQTPV